MKYMSKGAVRALSTALLLGPFGAQTLGAATLSITENFNDQTGEGSYSVTVNAPQATQLIGFGVSNIGSVASVGAFGTDLDCQTSSDDSWQWCYEAITVTAANWETTLVNSADPGGDTMADAFGLFEDNVEDGEDTINWYLANDGAMRGGDSSDAYFLFEAASALSIGLGYFSDGSGGTTALSSIVVTNPISAVPVPGSALLLLGGLGLLGAASRRKG